jgi:hypothetical protein
MLFSIPEGFMDVRTVFSGVVAAGVMFAQQ